MVKKSTTIRFFVFIFIMILLVFYINKEKVISEDNHEMEIEEVLEEETTPLWEFDGPIYNEDGSVTIPEGYTAYGFYSLETDKIIDSGTIIKVPGDILQGRISFQQNFPEEKSYLLIVLIDYIQHEFYVADQHYQSYSFKLKGESEMNMDISVDLAKSEGKEFSFIIVPNPTEKNFLADGEYNWDTMFSSRSLIVSRYGLDRLCFKPNEKQDFSRNYVEFQAPGNISGFELVKSRDSLNAFASGKGGEALELVILNQAQGAEEKDYIVVGFADWEQVPIDGKYTNCYVTIPSETSISIPITLPVVEKPTIFQIIAFNDPDTASNRYAWDALTTFRVLVNP